MMSSSPSMCPTANSDLISTRMNQSRTPGFSDAWNNAKSSGKKLDLHLSRLVKRSVMTVRIIHKTVITDSHGEIEFAGLN